MKTATQTPTIGNLLASMPKEGVGTVEDRLAAYATLGYHHDKIDRRTGHSVRKIKQFIEALDTATNNALGPLTVEDTNDEDSDLFGVTISCVGLGEKQVMFKSPSLANMPKTNPHQGQFLQDAITRLALDPELVLNLPYTLFPVISEPLGRALGFL